MCAHEHARRTKIPGYIIFKRTENDVLFSVESPARQSQLILRMLKQVLSDWKRIGKYLHSLVGQQMHHLVGGGATIDNDIITVATQSSRLTCNSPLFYYMHGLVNTEWTTC